MANDKPVIRFRARPGSSATVPPRLIGDPPSGSGKKRQPNKGSWTKGVCPNPKGRPKGAKGIKAITRKVLSEKVTVRGANGPKKVQLYEGLLRKEAELAAGGDWRARKTILELGKWALGDPVETLKTLLPEDRQAEEVTAAGQAILDLYAAEIREDVATGAPRTQQEGA